MFCQQCLHDLQFKKTRYSSPNLSKLARADISCQFKETNYLCRHCLQTKWTLVFFILCTAPYTTFHAARLILVQPARSSGTKTTKIRAINSGRHASANKSFFIEHQMGRWPLWTIWRNFWYNMVSRICLYDMLIRWFYENFDTKYESTKVNVRDIKKRILQFSNSRI